MSTNILKIGNQNAVISYDPDIEMFRGAFLGLSGGADFYATDIDGLKQEGEISLRVYLQQCKEKGIEPYKNFSGKFNLRISPELHQELTELAAANNASLNDFVQDTLSQAVEHREQRHG